MICLVCPWGNATGGTELLHQLGYTLNNLNYDARMYYIYEEKYIPACNPQFEKYEVSRIEYVPDGNDDIIILPELIARQIHSFDGVKYAKKILWWMSVDNAGLSCEDEKVLKGYDNLLHFVQSYYAKEYVTDHLGIPSDRVYYLSDYIGTRFLNVPNNPNRQNIVLFNPRKGFGKTSELIKNSNANILWRALEGISCDDMPKVLLSAKVYVDFGNHPGKDRFPREAVSCGCRVITGRRGAAAYYEDVMLPDGLKIDDNEDSQEILKKIYSLIAGYNENSVLYEEYYNFIHEEFHLFEIDVYKIFEKIVPNKIIFNYENDRDFETAICNAIENQSYKKAYNLVVMYRSKKGREYKDYDEKFLLLEAYVRFGLKQYEIAEYMINNITKLNVHNYEAHLLLAEVLYYNKSSNDRIIRISKAIEDAILESEGTSDFMLVGKRAEDILSMLKEELLG